MAALWGSRGRAIALVTALVGAVAAPLAWQATFGRTMSRVDDGSLQVVARSGALLLRHGTPYLPADQISRVLDYNPYEPAMTIFGLPAAAGLHGAAGNPRLWMAITAAAVLFAAFHLVKPGSAVRTTAFAFGSPALALPLASGLTDLPVLSLLLLALACTAAHPHRHPRPRLQQAAAIAVGAACAIKATAWPALPVMAALAARDGARVATRFVVTACITAAALIAATAPTSVTSPATLFQNTVLFPLGMTRYPTPADSPLPGHLLAATGPGGRLAAIAALCAASVAIAASLVVRPPADTQAATRRLAVSLAALFFLAPATRWGYFAYPAALLGFAITTRGHLGPSQQLPVLSPAITGQPARRPGRRYRILRPVAAGAAGTCEEIDSAVVPVLRAHAE
jgi:phosphatidylinositol alpha-1,6-mannosyltransferase